jgi:hypothetical protein
MPAAGGHRHADLDEAIGIGREQCARSIRTTWPKLEYRSAGLDRRKTSRTGFCIQLHDRRGTRDRRRHDRRRTTSLELRLAARGQFCQRLGCVSFAESPIRIYIGNSAKVASLTSWIAFSPRAASSVGVQSARADALIPGRQWDIPLPSGPSCQSPPRLDRWWTKNRAAKRLAPRRDGPCRMAGQTRLALRRSGSRALPIGRGSRPVRGRHRSRKQLRKSLIARPEPGAADLVRIGVSVRRTLPTIWVQSCNVAAVPRQLV